MRKTVLIVIAAAFAAFAILPTHAEVFSEVVP
jgi:hypothetical protein